MSCLRKTTSAPEAMLCGLVTAMEGRGMLAVALGDVNWGEAGVTREDFDEWYAEHAKADAVA